MSRTLSPCARPVYAIVKGSEHAARLAAEIRDIPYKVISGWTREGETMLRVPESHSGAVYDWAVEPGSFPYPVGACVGVYRGTA